MALSMLQNVVLLVGNPSFYGDPVDNATIVRNITAGTPDLAYSTQYSDSSTTMLADSYAPQEGGKLQGLTYVPQLAANDPCHQMADLHVPANVTRFVDLPNAEYNLVALAPWLGPACTESYYRAVTKDPTRALLFYVPKSGPGKPPDRDDALWDLGGRGAWITEDRVPVYALSGDAGEEMMQQLILYSGDLATVPFARNLTDHYRPDPTDFVRVWSELYIAPVQTLFPVWGLALIIAGVLIFVIASTTVCIHFALRRRRRARQRQIRYSDPADAEKISSPH